MKLNLRRLPRLLTRRHKPLPTDFCPLCGHTQGRDAFDRKSHWYRTCSYCGEPWSEWLFWRKLPLLGDKRLRLSLCAFKATRKRCKALLGVPASDLALQVGVGGNGPGWYYLATRHRIQGRCDCGHYAFSREIMRANRSYLRKVAQRWSGTSNHSAE